jgi:hypothetical protein
LLVALIAAVRRILVLTAEAKRDAGVTAGAERR